MRPCLVLLAASSLFLAAAAIAADLQPGVAGLSREEALRLGERIYRQGILSSGEAVKAIVQGDTEVEGTMFSCESCHMRSGLGSYEGGVWTTPTTGKYLYSPLLMVRELTAAELGRIAEYFRPLFQAPPRRPAYTDETLAGALRDGVDPAGRTFHAVMPRYELGDRDMAILIYYLKSLSAEDSPGVTDTNIQLATVIAGDVSPEDREAAWKALESYVRGRNSRVNIFEGRKKYGMFAESMDVSYRKLSLARWELKGPPETWRAQLEEYYRKEPVFALVGGISNGEWRPVHEFSEEHRIPCLFPITDYPVLSSTDWYTLYLNKGFYQEGEAAARYLASAEDLGPGVAVVQVYRDTKEGRTFAAGFQETWQGLGREPPLNRMLQPGQAVTEEVLEGLPAGPAKPSVVLLWTGLEGIPALESLGSRKRRPARAILSSTLLGPDLRKLPDRVREFAYLTYPYAFPRKKGSSGKSRSPVVTQLDSGRRIESKMHSTCILFTDVLMMLRENFYRDRALDVIDMMQDRPHPYTDYERLSFGPGQRYASKGCYIVQLTRGNSPELVKKSDWVIR